MIIEEYIYILIPKKHQSLNDQPLKLMNRWLHSNTLH